MGEKPGPKKVMARRRSVPRRLRPPNSKGMTRPTRWLGHLRWSSRRDHRLNNVEPVAVRCSVEEESNWRCGPGEQLEESAAV